MKKLIILILAIVTLFAFTAKAITLLQVPQGGTGAGSFTSGECLVGNGTGGITTQACSGGGTVSSVAMSVPTGLSIAGTPITSSGTLALTYSAGYEGLVTTDKNNWNTAYGWGDHSTQNYFDIDTQTLDNIPDGATYKLLTAAEKTVIGNTSGTNTGDQDISAYMEDTDIDTFAELQSWAVGYTDNDTTYPYAINSVGVGGQVWKSDGVGIGGWGTDNNTTYTSSDFTHDDLTGFVANEHLDWTGDLGVVNIHAGNYTDNNTTYVSSDFTHNDLTGYEANRHLDWTTDLGAVNINAGNYTDTNTTYTAGTGLTLTTGTFSVNTSQNIATLSSLTTNGFITTSGGIGTLGIDTSTYLTGNQSITLSGDVAGSGTTAITTTIGANKILESMLKSVNAPTDEYVLTYEATTGDFEWQSVAGGGDITQVFDCATGDCNTMTVGTSEWLTYGTGFIDANRFLGVTTVDSSEFGYLNGVTSAIQTQFTGKQSTLTNSAGLLGALSDETGTGLSVFSTSPTFVTPLLGTPTSGVLTNCTGTASGLTSGNVTTNANLTGDITSTGNATTITADVITHADIADSDQADTKCLYLEDPVADDDLKSIWRNSTANNFLITEIWAESDQTVSFDLQIDDGTPADVSGTDIAPAAGEAEDTSLTGDTTLAASEELDLIITSVSGTPTWLSICFTGQWVD